MCGVFKWNGWFSRFVGGELTIGIVGVIRRRREREKYDISATIVELNGGCDRLHQIVETSDQLLLVVVLRIARCLFIFIQCSMRVFPSVYGDTDYSALYANTFLVNSIITVAMRVHSDWW